MDTPICDFVCRYCADATLRCHMPGHKGIGPLGMEALDITEFEGADCLYAPRGIIAESQANAGLLFGARTFYSTEGSSLCIRAMLRLALLHARQAGKPPVILAARNVHKTFLSAVALLDGQVRWLYPAEEASYLSCRPEPEALDRALREDPAGIVYVTSPDYLGTMADIAGLAQVAHRHGALLLVDNAHGAYLKFLPNSLHPMDLGADLCCDSAHKTLPGLTGTAYLHISPRAPAELAGLAPEALALFGSTSPSYLLLQSLDRLNAYLAEGYPARLAAFLSRLDQTRQRLIRQGYSLVGSEPLKLTLAPKSYGYTGDALAALLLEQGIVCEFHDPDHLVCMLTPETGESGLCRLEQALLALPAKAPCPLVPPAFRPCPTVRSIREAALMPGVTVAAAESVGRILTGLSVSCPPAVPIVICGERITPEAAECFSYYGICHCTVAGEPL